jgi:hypothetical protein
MDQSPAHIAAVAEAVRAPALSARLDMLAQGAAADPARLELFATTRPDPGASAGGDPVVIIDFTSTAGTVVDETVEAVRSVRLEIDTPIEGQVTGADTATGSIPLWGRIYTPAGDWWADVSVSVEDGGGEVQLSATGTEGEPATPVARLFNGAYARLSSFVMAG